MPPCEDSLKNRERNATLALERDSSCETRSRTETLTTALRGALLFLHSEVHRPVEIDK